MLGAPMSAHLASAGAPGVLVLIGLLALLAAITWLTVLDARTHQPALHLPDDQPAEVVAAAERVRRVAPYLP